MVAATIIPHFLHINVFLFSSELKCQMNFGIYLPPQFKSDGDKLPVVYYLSGLTCTEQNVVTKGGAQQYASQHGIIFVAPDTSPRKLWNGVLMTDERCTTHAHTMRVHYIGCSLKWGTDDLLSPSISTELL